MPSFISRPAELILKNLRGGLSDEQEQKEYDQLVTGNEEIQLLLQRVSDDDYAKAQIALMAGFDPLPDWVETEALPKINLRKGAWRTYTAAAILIGIVITVAIYFVVTNYSNPQKEETVHEKPQIQVEEKPVVTHNHAYLLLPDSTKIGLATAADGLMTFQNGSEFRKNGKLITYESQPETLASDFDTAAYYTLVADRGGDFRLALPDGSLVQLNSGSLVRFPVHFAGRERKVEIVGEAFFEVKEDLSRPFVVRSGNVEAEVLGTQFNIKAHPGDSIITTLVTGSVRVNSGGKSETLSPGIQIAVSGNGKFGEAKQVKIDRVTAWKDEKFDFRDLELPVILAELGRWYNLEVDLSKVPKVKRAGVYPRSIPIKEVLIHLSAPSDVQLKLEGNRIVVY